MLLRLHISGFKNLLDVQVRFGAFTCIFGENGVGKSNLFDAIRLVSLLADGRPFPLALQQLREASGRSAPAESFLTHLGEWRASEIAIEADMLVAASATDDFNNLAHAQSRVLRYRLRLGHEGSQLRLLQESLAPVRAPEARAMLEPLVRGRAIPESIIPKKKSDYISTSGGAVSLHQDGHQGRKRPIPISRSQRTVLGDAGHGMEFPTVLVARREMQAWRTLALEPSAMRSPSLYVDPDTIDAQGKHVAGTLHRLTRGTDARAVFARIANRLHRLLPEVRDIDVDDDPKTEQRTVRVKMADGVWYPARALSDGTLRFLVIATLAEDPRAEGVLCLEEPENGIHPERVPAMVDLLREVGAAGRLATDGPLRQVIVNTHSPLVHDAVPKDDRLWLVATESLREGHAGTVAAVRVEADTWRAKAGDELIAPGTARAWEQIEFGYDDRREVAEE